MNLTGSHMSWNHELAPADSLDVFRGGKVFSHHFFSAFRKDKGNGLSGSSSTFTFISVWNTRNVWEKTALSVQVRSRASGIPGKILFYIWNWNLFTKWCQMLYIWLFQKDHWFGLCCILAPSLCSEINLLPFPFMLFFSQLLFPFSLVLYQGILFLQNRDFSSWFCIFSPYDSGENFLVVKG